MIKKRNLVLFWGGRGELVFNLVAYQTSVDYTQYILSLIKQEENIQVRGRRGLIPFPSPICKFIMLK